ncbi:MAG: 50S ribosomal protein L1 [Gammaproteobacteria bacterium]|nr:50S ribosomal protein L1 [Gammaproteobacteria bacterium]
MTKLSKRVKAAQEKVDRTKDYTIDEALELIEELATSKMKESIDIAINLGINSKQTDQNIRGATILPHGNGKQVRVAVFADAAQADEAREAGADLVGMDDLADQVKAGELNFDVAIAARNAMRVVGQLGRILGPRGLMPNPKTGTVTDDIALAVKNAKSGQVQYRTDRGGVVHTRVGMVGQDKNHVQENIEALITELKKVKPPKAKGRYLKRITVSTTMGPGVKVDEASLRV